MSLESESNMNGNREHFEYKSVVLEQPCRHFSSDMNCFRTTWKSRRLSTTNESFMSNMCTSVNNEPDSSKLFTMKWTRMKPPSSSKWSRDVQNYGDVSPGQLVLSLPSVYTSSRSNATSISKLLDENIEYLIEQRLVILNNTKSNQSPTSR